MSWRWNLCGAAAIAALVASGCGGKGGGGDEDASDTTQPDTATDTGTDTGLDAPDDTGPADAVTDTDEDTAPADAPDDVPGDWPTDVPADWPLETSSECEAAGGFCTAYHWDVCPPGYEPAAPDEVLGCGGRCCLVAPYSTCSAASDLNCIAAESCTGCWSNPSSGSYTCEEGRVCCAYVCE
jgi:hypothetical protein